MYGYVYLTTNLVNGKQYIGQHKSKVFDIYYLGSGKLIKSAINKYGRKNFSCEILSIAGSKEELDKQEIFWIAKYNAATSEQFYNIANGGNTIGTVAESTKKRISKAHKGKKLTAEQRKKMSDAKKGTHQSEIHKQHLSEARKGLKRSEETKRKISESLKTNVPWNKGKKMSDEYKRSRSEGQKRRLSKINATA
jgi:group I intron endonuclease